MELVSTDGWGKLPQEYATVDPEDRVYFGVHHSTGRVLGDSDPKAWLRAIDRYHTGQLIDGVWRATRPNGHPSITLGFGYNLAGDWLRRAYVGRGVHALGAHVAGYNTSTVGMVILGDYREDHDPVTDDIRQLLREAWRYVSNVLGKELIPKPHSFFAATACPGVLDQYVNDGLPPVQTIIPAPRPPRVTRWSDDLVSNLPTVRRGSHRNGSPWNKRVQSLIASEGHPPANTFDAAGNPDGVWGDGTDRAVRAWQAANNVPNSVLSNGDGDGIFGRQSWTSVLGIQ